MSVDQPDDDRIKTRSCVFCDRIAAHDYEDWAKTVARFAPLNPVTPGHMLFVPLDHLTDASTNPAETGNVFAAASSWANYRNEDFSLITSGGSAATQSVWHLHVHYVPRREGDGLHLPWTGQKRA